MNAFLEMVSVFTKASELLWNVLRTSVIEGAERASLGKVQKGAFLVFIE